MTTTGRNRSSTRSGHIVQNRTQITQWDFQNKGTLTSPLRLSFVLKADSQHNLFRTIWPDRERAYWHLLETFYIKNLNLSITGRIKASNERELNLFLWSVWSVWLLSICFDLTTRLLLWNRPKILRKPFCIVKKKKTWFSTMLTILGFVFFSSVPNCTGWCWISSYLWKTAIYQNTVGMAYWFDHHSHSGSWSSERLSVEFCSDDGLMLAKQNFQFRFGVNLPFSSSNCKSGKCFSCWLMQPYTSNIYSRRVLSGEFQIISQHLSKLLK